MDAPGKLFGVIGTMAAASLRQAAGSAACSAGEDKLYAQRMVRSHAEQVGRRAASQVALPLAA